jgi:hypothetical protein
MKIDSAATARAQSVVSQVNKSVNVIFALVRSGINPGDRDSQVQ